MKKVHMVTLGCDKNLVDAENMLGYLKKAGYELTNDNEEADVIIVNTCSFINDAKEESINAILEQTQLKEIYKDKKVLVAGCLAERYKDQVIEEIPEIDGIIGVKNIQDIGKVVEDLYSHEHLVEIATEKPDDLTDIRVLTTTTYSTYLKISEGCDNHCTYCVIPSIRGKYKSRKLEDLVLEAQYLAAQGIKELLFVAQDVTRYGIDLYGEKRLPELIRAIAKVEGIEWIRLLYCYPEEIDDALIQVIKEEPKVCHYIDMPIQHSHTEVLKRMARRSTTEQLTLLVNKLRSEIPDISLRTTLIVGFPGESDEMFESMLGFVKEMAFDRLGVFEYSQEENTKAATFEDQIDDTIKAKRKDAIMVAQQEISIQNNEKMIGTVQRIMVEGYLSDDEVFVGRTYKDAPEIDGLVFFTSPYEHLTGDFINVTITKAEEYDLIGEYVDEFGE